MVKLNWKRKTDCLRPSYFILHFSFFPYLSRFFPIYYDVMKFFTSSNFNLLIHFKIFSMIFCVFSPCLLDSFSDLYHLFMFLPPFFRHILRVKCLRLSNFTLFTFYIMSMFSKYLGSRIVFPKNIVIILINFT